LEYTIGKSIENTFGKVLRAFVVIGIIADGTG